MAKKRSDEVTLRRGEKVRRRRFGWWIIPLLLLILIGGAAAYIFQKRIIADIKPHPTIPPDIPTPAPGGTPGLLYDSSFDNPAATANWEFFDDGRISAAVKDGRLVVGVNALTDTGTWSGLNFTVQDFILDVDATKVAGRDDNGIIVVFRLTDKENYNRFDISSDGFYSLSAARAGVHRTISEFNASSAIKQGSAVNHIRITARGDTFRFEVNGTPLLLCWSADVSVQPLWDPANPNQCLGGTLTDTWQNSDLPKGKIGLGAQGIPGLNGEPAAATIAFDNVTIKSPEIP